MKSSNLLSVLSVVFSLVSLFLAKPIQAQENEAVLFANDPQSKINVRSEPTTNSTILHSGNHGESIKILGKVQRNDGTWFDVQIQSGVRGWVRGDLLKFTTQIQAQLKLSCDEAIASVINKLEAGRDLRVVFKEKTQHSYYTDYPEGRADSINLGMIGSSTESVLKSRVLLTSLATRIVQSCSSISLVSFGQYKTDYVRSYGLLANGRVEVFVCIDSDIARRGYKVRWGETVCI